METTFKEAIKEHLELKEQNRWIESDMPLSRYRSEVPGLETHSAEGVDETGDVLDPDGPAGWPTAEGLGLEAPTALWSAQPAFDWGE